MAKFYENEKWKECVFPHQLKLRYAVSNYGRMMSFKKTTKDGNILKCSDVDGYKVFRYKVTTKKGVQNKHFFVHRLVAEKFLPKPQKLQTYVLHLNRTRGNNKASNLKWGSKEELVLHNKRSPKVIAARKKLIEFNRMRDGQKLTVKQVTRLKTILLNPKRKETIQKISQRFNISEMQAYRIKSGENWGHIKV
ncbi:MAG: HNH endonuclease [Flavobacteriales bacterium]|nr:HNH endonuclease [Flavobacteriales bacterium]